MTATFLVTLDTDSDTDLIGISTELEHVLEQNLPYHILSVKPWQRQATFVPPGPT